MATELKEEIEKELRGATKIEAQLGLLPSITSVGMAALLSGTSLEFTSDFKDVLCDGMSTKSSAARQKVLEKSSQVDAAVVSATELLSMTVEEGRETIKPCRLIYIYHNQIDAIGDKPASESQVMSACETAIAELIKLVKKICNSLNGTRVFITADHGFLYQRRAIAEPDKLPLPKDDDILDTSRRYLMRFHAGCVSPQNINISGTQSFTMPYDTNSNSPQPTAREFPQTLTITVGNPPVTAYLAVSDCEDDQELVKETWTISLAISNDFGDF